MAVRNILTVPNEILKKQCEPVKEFNAETKKLAKDLLDTVKATRDPEGAGLAAPQIGVLKCMIVVRQFIYSKNEDEDGDDEKELRIVDHVFINPEIIKVSDEKTCAWEACLSIPDTYALIERPKKVKVEAYDETGKKITIGASGFFARVIQHEIDHLSGIILNDRAIGDVITEEQFERMQESLSL